MEEEKKIQLTIDDLIFRIGELDSKNIGLQKVIKALSEENKALKEKLNTMPEPVKQ